MIGTELAERTLLVRLDRPERRTALDEEMLSAARAYELGLLTEALPEELLPAAHALAADALRRAPQSSGLTKRVLLLSASADLGSGLSAETIAQSLLVGTEDRREGARTVRERRPPSFTGR